MNDTPTADKDAPRGYVLWDLKNDRAVTVVLPLEECEDVAETYPHPTEILALRVFPSDGSES